MIKRLPYGTSNFGLLITDNYYYIDKTNYIAQLECESNKYQFFIRPRKFGKSLFISTLNYYYDINKASQFDLLFKDTYIGIQPTPERNSYALLNFDFSGLDTSSPESFIQSFKDEIRSSLSVFLDDYSTHDLKIKNVIDYLDTEEIFSVLTRTFGAFASASLPLYVIIDEYDHFANDLIAMGKDEVYKKMIRANGVVRDFYETLKKGTKISLRRIFITGISPVMLDDLTSGFNIATNLTLDENYNEMMGFTQSELDAILEHCKVDPKLINVAQLKMYYDGYLFSELASERLYNPSMLFYYLNSIIEKKRPPKMIYDENMRTDYNRLKNLTTQSENKLQLESIILNEYIDGHLLNKFSIDNLGDTGYFISLLFYMGLLTIEGIVGTKMRFRIPNYTIKTLYWEYLDLMLRTDNADIQFDSADYSGGIDSLSQGDAQAFIQHISTDILAKLSNRDLLNFDEKYIKAILLTRLLASKIYYPISEPENANGYSDIYLCRTPTFPNIPFEWLFELKYVKEKDRDKLPEIKEKALAQLAQYSQAQPYKGRTDIKTAALIFIGKTEVHVVVGA